MQGVAALCGMRKKTTNHSQKFLDEGHMPGARLSNEQFQKRRSDFEKRITPSCGFVNRSELFTRSCSFQY
jgi:hypothetical protein